MLAVLGDMKCVAVLIDLFVNCFIGVGVGHVPKGDTILSVCNKAIVSKYARGIGCVTTSNVMRRIVSHSFSSWRAPYNQQLPTPNPEQPSSSAKSRSE